MAATQLPNNPTTVLQPTGPGSSTALNTIWTSADTVNGNFFQATGRDLVEVYNADTSAHNLNVTSAPDACTGRTANITNYSIPPSTDAQTKGHVSFLVVPSSVFTQNNGTVQLSADNALVYFLIRSF